MAFRSIDFFPFSFSLPVSYISTVGFVVNTVKLLHILIAVSFGNARQSDF